VTEPTPLNTASTGVVGDPNGMFGEKTVARLRHHAGSLLWPALAFIVLTSATGFALGFVTESWLQLVVWIGYAVLVAALVIVPWLRWLASTVVITTHRVIISEGLFARSRREVLLIRVHDVSVRRSAGQMLFGSGDILLGVGAEKPVRIHALPRPNLVLAALTELVHGVNPRAR
jgi:membrane protein YdbS with pleckstrin-like domain